MRRVPLVHAPWFAVGSALLVLAINAGLAAATRSQLGDYLAIAYFGLYGLYCVRNYLRCREVHCAITGPGFLLAAGLMVLRDAHVFDHGFGVPYLVFVLAALVGHLLEWRYWKRTGTRFRPM